MILIDCIMKKFFTFLLVVVLVLLCLRIAGVWKSEPDDKNKNKALEPVEVDTTADSVAMDKQCEVYVSTLDNQDLVSRITVCFPIQDQWKNLYGDYKTLKEMLVEKYGRPVSCVERFTGSLGNLGDDFRMIAVRNDECQYVTRFASDEGDIILSIEYRGSSTCYVQLVYKDKENGQVVRNAAIEDL